MFLNELKSPFLLELERISSIFWLGVGHHMADYLKNSSRMGFSIGNKYTLYKKFSPGYLWDVTNWIDYLEFTGSIYMGIRKPVIKLVLCITGF